MNYKLIFLIILTLFTTFISMFVNEVKLFLILLLICFLLLYSLTGHYFNRRIQNNLNIILYLGIGVFIIIVFQKAIEILNG
ncbi:hypothetical protein KKP91_03745 [Methanothermococcus sp. SCGC AD-155-M21]|nr:hypothetical protein [Methanothermococcus sp. SCGC AD-155-M21]